MRAVSAAHRLKVPTVSKKKQIMSTAWTNCTSSRIVPAALLKFPQALNTGGSVFAVSLSASAGVDVQT